MLIIRNEQMKSFGAAARERFVADTGEELSRRLHLETDAAVALVRAGVAKASAHGIDLREDVVFMCELMHRFGPEFEEQPEMRWTRPILEHEELPGWGKMKLIRARMASSPGLQDERRA